MGLRGPAVLALLALGASAQEWPADLPAAGREALTRDGVWVGPKTFRQVFAAYNNPPCPVFVTTDGMIVAGYRLMERTVMRMERWSFAKLPPGLRELEAEIGKAERGLRLPAETCVVAGRRARLVVSVALLLLGEKPQGLDEATLAQARECASLVEKAQGRSMPPGLGSPDAGWLGFDWRVFRPRGPYAGDERMERAFRATLWLQSVPFRLERDDEVAALWLIKRAKEWFWPSPMWADELLPVAQQGSVFAGAFWGLRVREFGPAQLEALRARVRGGLGTRLSADLLHETPRGDEIRLAPRAVLPEDDLFFALLHPEGQPGLPGLEFPAGLAVASALGSPTARERLVALRDRSWLRDVPLAEGSTWTAHAHRMRSALLDAAEPDAPALFSSPAWQRKALRTALGSWALERNVWTLHSGPVMTVFSGPEQLPGLVEPDPDVFARLAGMGRSVLAWMEGEEVDDEAMRIEYADGVLGSTRSAIASLLDPNGFPPPELRFLLDLEKIGVLTEAERRVASEGVDDRAEGVRKLWRPDGGRDRDLEAETRAVRARLDPVLAACERWHARMTDLAAAAEGPARGTPLRPKWECWIELCTRLELLAHKQLRQRPWSDEEVSFLKEYGTELAEIMGYSFGSLNHARDDAPRAASVVCDPESTVMRVIGTGRPRELWVLYPHRGERVVCRGVVLSYYELDAEDAPTDAEWKAMLDSKEPPREPAWLE